jgi:DNA polymerase-3 subunit epsilon
MSPIETYKQAFAETWTRRLARGPVRFVVLDCETTGVQPGPGSHPDHRARGGATAGEIWLDDSFDAMVRVTGDVGPVAVHGVTPDQSSRGDDQDATLQRFLPYLRDGVIVGHHIGHDVSMLDAGLERMGGGVQLLNRTLDTGDLALHLAKDGAFADRALPGHLSLDSLADLFGVIPHDRHTASGDAFITALVFLRLLKLASQHGRTSLASICQEFVPPE